MTAGPGSPTGFGGGGAADPDPYRYSDTTAAAHEGVSGFYLHVNSVLFSSSFPMTINGVSVPDPSGGDPIEVADTTLFPNGFAFIGGGALCDAEILGDGSGPEGFPEDESQVDGTKTDGEVPDGTFDDGGLGAVCHTPKTHYDFQPFNTDGCLGTAHGEDWALGGDVWIGATCTWGHNAGSAPGLSTCIVNSVLSGSSDPVGLLVPEASDCVTNYANCRTDPTCATGTDFSCGARSSGGVGAQSMGIGGGDGGAGVAFPTAGIAAAGCAQTDTTAAIWAFGFIDDAPTFHQTVAGWLDNIK